MRSPTGLTPNACDFARHTASSCIPIKNLLGQYQTLENALLIAISPDYPVLHLRSQGPTVRQLQRNLNARFEQLTIMADISVRVDGNFGLETLVSIKYLQCIGGLPVNGEVEKRTLAFLTRGVTGLETLSIGSFGTGVLAVQQAIRQAQVQVVTDSRFGPLTASGVKHYQQKSNLLVDGIVGPQTWKEIVRSRLRTLPCVALLPNPYST